MFGMGAGEPVTLAIQTRTANTATSMLFISEKN